MQATALPRPETFLCAHFTKNGHNYSMLQIKISGRSKQKKEIFHLSELKRSNANETANKKIIGTIFKLNQNQITSKFRNLNHSRVARFGFCDLEFLMFIFFVVENGDDAVGTLKLLVKN